MIEIAKESLVDVYRKYNAKQIKMFKFSPKRLGWLLLPFYLVLFALYHMYLLLFSPFVSLRLVKRRKLKFFYGFLSFFGLAGTIGFLELLIMQLTGVMSTEGSPLLFLIPVFLLIEITFIIKVIKTAKIKIPVYDDVANEVLLTKGEKAQKAFLKQTALLAKSKKIQELNAVLNNEHKYYQKNEHLIIDKKVYKKTAGQICIAVGLIEGSSAIKSVKTQLDKLYNVREYQKIHDMFIKYKPHIDTYKERLESFGLSSDEFIKVFYGSKIYYFFTLIKANLFCKEEMPVFVQNSKEVILAKGKKAQRRFINYAFKLSKDSKFDQLGTLLKQEQAYYKSVESLIWTQNEYEEKSRVILLGYALFDKTSSSQDVKKRIARLYKDRELKVLNELYAKYYPQVEDYKNSIIKTEGKQAFSLEYDGKGTFDGYLIQKIGLEILCGLVNVVTLFIAFPATICWKQKWLCKHTVYDGKRLSFDGNGMQLFGKWLLWLFLSVITFGVYLIFLPNKIEAWKAKHTHINGEIKNLGGTFDGSVLGRFALSVLCAIVNVFTLFICLPFTICWKQKWLCKHTVYDGKRLSFNGNGLQLIGKWVLWCLLTLVTFGVYGLFVSIRMEKWKASHIHLSKDYEFVL